MGFSLTILRAKNNIKVSLLGLQSSVSDLQFAILKQGYANYRNCTSV